MDTQTVINAATATIADPQVDPRWTFTELRDPHCERCTLGPLNKKLRCLPGVGPKGAEMMLVGEAPGRREIAPDVRRPFAGPAGQYLDKALDNAGLVREEMFITNVICCHPPGNRDPSGEEITACRWLLEAQIREVEPKRILALGNVALKALTGRSGISEHRGTKFVTHFNGVPHPIEVMATYHPSYVRKSPRMYPVLFTDLVRFKGVKRSHSETYYSYIEDMGQFRALVRRLLKAPEVAFDIETEHLDSWTGAKIICISLSDKEGYGYVVPLEGGYGCSHERSEFWSEGELKEVHRLLGAILGSSHRQVVAFNSKFDLQWLWTRGIKAKCDFDPMVASIILDENLPHSLEANVQMYLDPSFSKPEPKKIYQWPWERIWPYSAEDSDWTLRLSHELFPRVERNRKYRNLYYHLLKDVQTKLLPQVELDGTYIIKDNVAAAKEECEQGKQVAEEKIFKYVPPDYVPPVKSKKAIKKGFNPGSPKQLGDLLFDKLGLPILAYTEGGDPSTAEAILLELLGQHPILEEILELRAHEKNLGFIDSWEELQDVNGFIHPHYHLKPVTGRLSSSDPNLQQVPREGKMRKCIGAPPGFKVAKFDYSQIEMRIAGHESKDENLIGVFNRREDIHKDTASQVMGVDPEEVTKEDRKAAKAVNFGLIFGMGADKLMRYAKEKYGVDMTLAQAANYRNGYFKRFPGLERWHNKQITFVNKHHYVESFIGRIRHLPDILSSDWKARAEAERQAINSPVQSLASDLNLLSAIQVIKIMPRSVGWLWGLVHDESLYFIRDEYLEEWVPKIKYIMENPPFHWFTKGKFLVPIEVEAKVSPTWGG